MNYQIFLYILIMAGVTYLIRVLPLTMLRGEIVSPFIRSFLYYVPYVTLAVMIFPGILYVTANMLSAILGLTAAVLVAYKKENLFLSAVMSCLTVFIAEFVLMP